MLKGKGGYAYEWYCQSDGSGSFTNPPATSGNGEVFSDWRRFTDGKGRVQTFISEEGRNYLSCGGLCVKWSLGNWLYFDDSTCAEVEIAVTDISNINEIDYLDSGLTWYGQRYQRASGVNVWGTGVGVAVGKFFLVRRRNACAAFRFTGLCSRGTRGYEYEGFGQPDSSGAFTGPETRRTTGEVFETWKPDERGGPCWNSPDCDHVRFLTCGGMQVEWSGSFGNWILFDAPGGDVEIAATNASDIAEVNCLDSSLTWHYALDSNYLPVEVNDIAIRVPARCFILARNEQGCAAFKVAGRALRHERGYKYVWYWQTGESGGFARPGVESGSGEVFDDYENYYEEHRRLDYAGDGWRDENDGTRYLNCGPLTLKWSLGNWIYFDSPQGRAEIAVTEVTNIEEVNCQDVGLTWHRGKSNLSSENREEV